MPDGTRIGMRESAGSTKLSALDVKYPPGEGWEKVHINPRAGGIPEIPAAPRPADGAGPGRGVSPGAVPPAVVEPQAEPKAPPVRGGPLGGLPVGGVVPDGSVPRLVDPPGPDAGGPDLPVIGDGEPDGPQT